MKLLLDMNLSKAWLSVLREAGHDVAHWSECGAATAPDIEIMNYARTHGFVILTHGLDFGTLLSSTTDTTPSVIQLRADNLTPAAAGSIVLRTLLLTRTELEQGALITIDTARTRLRMLPL